MKILKILPLFMLTLVAVLSLIALAPNLGTANAAPAQLFEDQATDLALLSQADGLEFSMGLCIHCLVTGPEECFTVLLEGRRCGEGLICRCLFCGGAFDCFLSTF